MRNHERGFGELVSSVADGFSRLVAQHLALARAELTRDAKAAAKDVAGLAVFVPFILLGYVLLCVALAVLLGRWVSMAGGFGIVGGAHVLIGAVGVAVAANRLKKREMLATTSEELGRTAAVLKAPATPPASLERATARTEGRLDGR